MTETRLTDCVTLKEIAPHIGSYSTAYALATAGAFGAPVAVLGRTQLFPRTAVEPAIAAYIAKRQPRGGRAE
jgi:hypothetical protein